MGGELKGEFFDDFIDGLRFGIYHGTSVKLRMQLSEVKCMMFLSMGIHKEKKRIKSEIP
jgi:hypothetical protein